MVKRWYGGRATAASLCTCVQWENSYWLVNSVLGREWLQDSALHLSFEPFWVVNTQKASVAWFSGARQRALLYRSCVLWCHSWRRLQTFRDLKQVSKLKATVNQILKMQFTCDYTLFAQNAIFGKLKLQQVLSFTLSKFLICISRFLTFVSLQPQISEGQRVNLCHPTVRVPEDCAGTCLPWASKRSWIKNWSTTE